MTPEEVLDRNLMIAQMREAGLIDETSAGNMRRVLLTDFLAPESAQQEER